MHVSLHLHAPTDPHVGTVASSQNSNLSPTTIPLCTSWELSCELRAQTLATAWCER